MSSLQSIEFFDGLKFKVNSSDLAIIGLKEGVVVDVITIKNKIIQKNSSIEPMTQIKEWVLKSMLLELSID